MKHSLTLTLLVCSFACGGPEPTSVESDSIQKSMGPYYWETCSRNPRAFQYVDSPQSPQGYKVPKNAVVATSAIHLRILARNGVTQDIVLPDGDYTLPQAGEPGFELPFMFLHHGDRLWAQNLGGARLHFGISVRQPSAELHGLNFQLDADADGIMVHNKLDPALDYGLALSIEQNGRDVTVSDCFFDGHGAVGAAISVRQTDGALIQRVDIQNYRISGIRVAQGPAVTKGFQEPEITDATVAFINDPLVPIQGVRESGIAIESNAHVDRVRVRDVGGSGVIVGANPTVGNITTSSLRNVDVDHYGRDTVYRSAGVYFEKRNLGTSLQRFCIGPLGVRGINIEWPGVNLTVPNVLVRISDGLIRSSEVGIWIDAHALDTRVDNVRFENAAHLAFGRHPTAAGTSACNLDFAQPAPVCDFSVGTYPLAQVAAPNCSPLAPLCW